MVTTEQSKRHELSASSVFTGVGCYPLLCVAENMNMSKQRQNLKRQDPVPCRGMPHRVVCSGSEAPDADLQRLWSYSLSRYLTISPV